MLNNMVNELTFQNSQLHTLTIQDGIVLFCGLEQGGETCSRSKVEIILKNITTENNSRKKTRKYFVSGHGTTVK